MESGKTGRPSVMLTAFALAVNSGVKSPEAARRAGYSPRSVAKVGEIVARARRFGLILTPEEARAPLALIEAAVSPDDWTEITKKAVGQAREGDAVARAWLTDRLVGKVTQGVEHSGSVALWYGFDPEVDEREHRNDNIDALAE